MIIDAIASLTRASTTMKDSSSVTLSSLSTITTKNHMFIHSPPPSPPRQPIIILPRGATQGLANLTVTFSDHLTKNSRETSHTSTSASSQRSQNTRRYVDSRSVVQALNLQYLVHCSKSFTDELNNSSTSGSQYSVYEYDEEDVVSVSSGIPKKEEDVQD